MKNKWGDWFYYDETSPSFLRWKVDRASRVRAGDACGYVNVQGYWSVMLNGKNFLQHRIIYEMIHEQELGEYYIDHIDGRRDNNIIGNLRKVTKSVNNRNCNKSVNNTSGITGVYSVIKHGKKYWVAKWRKINSVQCHKHFRVDYYGEEEAKNLAVKYRQNILRHLNEIDGAGYSEKHIMEI